MSRSAAQRWRTFGARSFFEAYGRLNSAYYRKWGAAIARANAGLRPHRASSLSAGGATACASTLRMTGWVWPHRGRSWSLWPMWVVGSVMGLGPPPPLEGAARARAVGADLRERMCE